MLSNVFQALMINLNQFIFADDKDEAESEAVVQALEHIDDDCDRFVHIVVFGNPLSVF